MTLIHGTADQVVAPRASEKYHEVYQHSQLHWVQDGDHRFSGDARATAIQLALAAF